MTGQTAPPRFDVLVVSHYQAECHETGCEWTGPMRSDLGDACTDAENHEAAHVLNAELRAQGNGNGRQIRGY